MSANNKNRSSESKRKSRHRVLANYLANNPTLYVDTLAMLRSKFKVFNYKTPLEIGIYQSIRTLTDIKSRDLSYFLKKYTTSPIYLANLKEGAVRYNLMGVAHGVVSSEEAKHAAELASRKAMKKLERHLAEQNS